MVVTKLVRARLDLLDRRSDKLRLVRARLDLLDRRSDKLRKELSALLNYLDLVVSHKPAEPAKVVVRPLKAEELEDVEEKKKKGGD